MYAIQGAMAIRRQRQMRENRRMSQIRISAKGGTGNSRRPSETDSQIPEPIPLSAPPKAETSQTAFYLGVVFILLGFLMIFSSMISNSTTDTDWSRLLGVGVTFLLVGLIMVMVNRIITTKEEEELTRYVSHRLGRSRSGHTLVRDIESGEDFHHQLQRSARILAANKSPRPSTSGPQKSPRDNQDPFPKFKQTSQGSTRPGSAQPSPSGPLPQNGHPVSKSSSTENHALHNGNRPAPIVSPEPDDSLKCQELLELRNGIDNPLGCVASPKISENGDSAFFSEVISETESLLKTNHNDQSIKKNRQKKNVCSESG